MIDCLIYLDRTSALRFNELVAPGHRQNVPIPVVSMWYKARLYEEEATVVFLIFEHVLVSSLPPYFTECFEA